MSVDTMGSSRNDENASLVSSPSHASSSSLPVTTSIPNTLASRVNRTILYFMAIHFCIAFTDIITVAPLIKLFETSLCETFYGFPVDGVGKRDCKILEVQRTLAKVRGVKSGLDMIPVLLVAIPLGHLGSRFGRRKIMALSIIGVIASLLEIYIISFPLKLVWLSSLLLLCGGGLNTATAFMYSMASEAIPSSERSQSYYYIFSAFYIAELIASFTAGMTIDISPWIPCFLALGSMVVCLFLLGFVSTPTLLPSMLQPSEENEPLLKPISSSTISSQEVLPRPQRTKTTLLRYLKNTKILLLVPTFLVSVFRYTTLSILIQYASVRFGLKISTGALFYTETAVANILLFLFVLPRVIEWFKSKRGWSGEDVDLWMVRGSLFFLCAGSLGIGIAPTYLILPAGVLIFAAGFGSSVSALSLISHWVDDTDKPAVYAAVVVLQSLGHAVGDPCLWGTYSFGLGKGGGWQAVPFYTVSGLYALALLSASFVRLDWLGAAGEEDVVIGSVSG